MKLDIGYTHTTQSSADIKIDDAHYLAWCREHRGHLTKNLTDEFLLTHDRAILDYLNYDPQFLSELIGWGEQDVEAHDIDFL